MVRFLLHILGVDNVSGYWYSFWSGFMGDVGLLATPIILLRRHNCIHRPCHRIGRHPVDGRLGEFTCRKHST